MGHQLKQKAFFQNGETTAVLLRGKNARLFDPGMMFQKTCKKHYGESSKNNKFCLLGKKKLTKMLQWKQYLMHFGGSNMLSTSTMCRGACHRWIGLGISRQMNVTHLYTTPEAIALSNKMKELNAKNKFRHKLGPGGYKAAMLKWTKKEQYLHEDGIPDPLEGCKVRTRNRIRGHSCTNDNEWLILQTLKLPTWLKKPRL
jgi:hypothetical protein